MIVEPNQLTKTQGLAVFFLFSGKRSLLLLFIVIDPVGWFALSYVEGFDTAVYCRFCQSIFDPRCRVGVFYTEPKLINILLINSLGHSIP